MCSFIYRPVHCHTPTKVTCKPEPTVSGATLKDEINPTSTAPTLKKETNPIATVPTIKIENKPPKTA